MAARMLFVCVKAEIILLLKHRGTKLVREAFSCSRHGGVGRRRFDLVEGRKGDKNRRLLGTAAVLMFDWKDMRRWRQRACEGLQLIFVTTAY